ncbi:MAG: type II toxin-antitoxin system RelE/ParE family toxin [Patescibacteria group bacterium]
MNVIILDEVKDFLIGLGENNESRVNRYIKILEDFGNLIKMPYSKNILPRIFELRVGGIHNIRLIYTYYNNSAIIFYSFMKKTEQISLQEINIIKTKFNNLHI